MWSIVPPTPQHRLAGPNAWKLQAANGSDIDCFGLSDQNVCIGDRTFYFTFIVADVTQPILGADFLAQNALAPNHRDGNLIDLNDFSTILFNPDDQHKTQPSADCKSSRITDINFVDQQNDPYYQLLDNYPSLSDPSFKAKEVSHGIKHYIPTACNPIQSKARKLAPDKLEIAKQEFEKLEKLGICVRGKSEWASPLMVAPKPGGGWRVCGDYRRLNNETPDDKYPVKSISDFNANLAGKKIFSKIDLLKGYHQIPVAKDDIPKTAVITPFGLFLFPRTPFGLKNAGQDFQRLMDAILGDIPYCFVYIDDILVASSTPKEHLKHLNIIFKILEDNGLVINRAKCVLGKSELDFLGYHVDSTGISPLPDRIEAIRAAQTPTTIKELQRFLGLINYYRRFIPRAAHHLFHLFEALKTKPKRLEWNSNRQNSFEAIKDALAKATMLNHPRPEASLALTTDASDIAIGGVLEQRGPSGWEPLGFYSTKLNGSQRNWPPFDRELLAAFKGIRHFRHMLEGRAFTLFTDHQSLVPALSKKSEPHTARQTYQLSAIAEYTTDIRYIAGKANVVADALSRPPDSPPTLDTEEHPDGENISSILKATPKVHNRQSVTFSDQPPKTLSEKTKDPKPNPSSKINLPVPDEKLEALSSTVNSVTSLGIDFIKMADEQLLDADLNRIRTDPNSGLALRKINIGSKDLLVDVSNGPARPFVPFSWRKKVFDTIHGLGHPGIDRTRQMVADKFVWPSLRSDVSRWARACLHCQLSKVKRNTVPDIGEFQLPQKRFAHIHADLTTMPESNGYRHLLTIVDRYTRWPQAIPLKDISTESVVDAIVHGWVSSFGIPQNITTDRGSQFTSAVWSQLLKTWGIKSNLTTAYHPEANGLVERLHRRLKEALTALCEGENHQWYWKLPMALLSIRTTLKPDIGSSPADLVFGEGLAVPGELLPENPLDDAELRQQRNRQLANLRLEVERLQPTNTSAHRQPQVHMPDDLQTASHVFIRRGGVQPTLASPYEGPFRVASRSASSFKVHIPGRGTEEIAIARIKPAFIDETVEDPIQDLEDNAPPSPPPPGRRPGPRTRVPEPTDRVTRQQAHSSKDLRFNSGGPSSSDPSRSRPVTAPPEPSNDVRQQQLPPTIPPSEAIADADSARDPTPSTSTAPATQRAAARPPPNPPPSPRFFTKPSERYFSARRPRPNINGIRDLISSHLHSPQF